MGLTSRSNEALPQRCWRPQALSDRISTLRSALDTSVFLPVQLWDSSWWVVGTHLVCLLRSSLRLESIGITKFAASLASGFWNPTRLGLRFSTRSVPTPMSLSAPIFVESYFTVTLSFTRPTSAQRANPLPKQVLCVHRVTASDPDQSVA
jgi:hypothetical protein